MGVLIGKQWDPDTIWDRETCSDNVKVWSLRKEAPLITFCHPNQQLKSNLSVLQNLRSTYWPRRENLIRIIAGLFKICIGRNITNVGMILKEWDQRQWERALYHSKLLYMEHKLEIPGHKICSWVCLMLGFSSLLLCGDTMPEFLRRVR